MKVSYKEIKKIDEMAIVRLCVKKNWCRACTNGAYTKLLSYGSEEKNITITELVEMATIILENTPKQWLKDYTMTSIMYELNLCCYSYFEEI